MEDNLVMTAGFAQFPKGTSIYETQKMIGCVLVIDTEKKKITDASFTFLMDITSNFVSSLIIDQPIENGIDHIIKNMEQRIFFPGKKAVIQSFISAYDQYCEAKVVT